MENCKSIHFATLYQFDNQKYEEISIARFMH